MMTSDNDSARPRAYVLPDIVQVEDTFTCIGRSQLILQYIFSYAAAICHSPWRKNVLQVCYEPVIRVSSKQESATAAALAAFAVPPATNVGFQSRTISSKLMRVAKNGKWVSVDEGMGLYEHTWACAPPARVSHCWVTIRTSQAMPHRQSLADRPGDALSRGSRVLLPVQTSSSDM